MNKTKFDSQVLAKEPVKVDDNVSHRSRWAPQDASTRKHVIVTDQPVRVNDQYRMPRNTDWSDTASAGRRPVRTPDLFTSQDTEAECFNKVACYHMPRH